MVSVLEREESGVVPLAFDARSTSKQLKQLRLRLVKVAVTVER